MNLVNFEEMPKGVLQALIDTANENPGKAVAVKSEDFAAIARDALQWRELEHSTKYGPNSVGASISSENAASRCRDAMISIKDRVGAMDPKARSALVTRQDLLKWHEAVYQSHVELQRLSQPNCFCLLDPKSLQDVPDYLGYFLSVDEGVAWYTAKFGEAKEGQDVKLRFHATTLCGIVSVTHCVVDGCMEQKVGWESMEVRI